MDSLGSVSELIHQLGGSNDQPAADLWRRFEPQLLRFIATMLQRGPKLNTSEDEIANEVFQALIRLARQGDFAQSRRDGFWQLMKKVAARKVIDHRRAEGRLRRGGGHVLPASALRDHHRIDCAQWQNYPARGIPPDLQVMATEMVERVAVLLSEEQREVFFLRMEGYTVQEIAAAIERSKPTVERRLRHIREILREWIAQHDSDIQPS